MKWSSCTTTSTAPPSRSRPSWAARRAPSNPRSSTPGADFIHCWGTAVTDLDARLRAAAQSWQHAIDNAHDKDDGLHIDSIDYVDHPMLAPNTPGIGPQRRARWVVAAASVCLVVGSAAFVAARQERHTSTAAASTCLQKLVMTGSFIAQSDPPQISVTVTNEGPASSTPAAAQSAPSPHLSIPTANWSSSPALQCRSASKDSYCPRRPNLTTTRPDYDSATQPADRPRTHRYSPSTSARWPGNQPAETPCSPPT